MAKYDVCKDLHLLKKYGLEELRITVNRRCSRVFNHDGLVASYSSRIYGEDYIEAYSEETTIKELKDDIIIKNEGNTFKIYFLSLIFYFNPSSGLTKLYERENVIVEIDRFTLKFLMNIDADIPFEKIAKLIDENIPKDFVIFEVLRKISFLQKNITVELLREYYRSITSRCCTLFNDVEVLKKYSKAVFSKLYRRDIVDFDSFCQSFGLPLSFLSALEDDSQAILSNHYSVYKNVLNVDIFHDKIVKCLLYYFNQGKIEQESIYHFVNENDANNMMKDEEAEAVVMFIKKNLYLGKRLGYTLRDLVRFLKSENLPINIETLQLKKMYLNKNLSMLKTTLHDVSDESVDLFMNTWHTTNICQAVKVFNELTS